MHLIPGQDIPPPLPASEMVDALVSTGRKTMKASKQFPLDKQHGVISEERVFEALVVGMSEEQRMDTLTRLQNAAKSSEARASTHGADAIEEDKLLHAMSRAALESYDPYGRIHVTGEEGKPHEWMAALNAPVGHWVVITDPLDGSAPFSLTMENYSFNALLYRVTPHGLIVQAAVIVRSNLSALVWTNESTSRVTYSPDPDMEFVDYADPAPSKYGTVSVVATTAEARQRIVPLLSVQDARYGLSTTKRGLTNPGLEIITVGGAPATSSLIVGGLSAIVFSASQAVHDALGLLPLIDLDCKAFRLGDGKRLSNTKLAELFNDPARPNTEGYLRIPPMVITVPQPRAQEIAIHMAKRLNGVAAQAEDELCLKK